MRAGVAVSAIAVRAALANRDEEAMLLLLAQARAESQPTRSQRAVIDAAFLYSHAHATSRDFAEIDFALGTLKRAAQRLLNDP
jgi:hypothetical protein